MKPFVTLRIDDPEGWLGVPDWLPVTLLTHETGHAKQLKQAMHATVEVPPFGPHGPPLSSALRRPLTLVPTPNPHPADRAPSVWPVAVALRTAVERRTLSPYHEYLRQTWGTPRFQMELDLDAYLHLEHL